MQLRLHILFFFVLFTASTIEAQKVHRKGSKLEVGDAEYSLQNYKEEYNLKARNKFRVLKPYFRKYFLKAHDAGFLKSLDTNACYFNIEPLIINLTSRDGFYTCRKYYKKENTSPYFLNGFPHWPFLISGGIVFFFNSDTVRTLKIIDSCTSHLLTLFTSDDISYIKKWAVWYPMWSNCITLAPHLIYKGKKVYWNENK